MKYHNPKKRNASTGETSKVTAEIMKFVTSNDDVKIVVIHGGSFFSSGNDLSAFSAGFMSGDVEKTLA